ADVRARDKNGWTALHVAAFANQPELIELLLAKGADLHARNAKGQTPLHTAAIGERREPLFEEGLKECEPPVRKRCGKQPASQPVSGGNPSTGGTETLKPVQLSKAQARRLGKVFDQSYRQIDKNGKKVTTNTRYAAFESVDAVELLLARGADATAK